MDVIFMDAKKWGRGEGLIFANCVGEKLGKILFVLPRCKSFNTLRRRQDKKGILYIF
jgi:hypothetical protein